MTSNTEGGGGWARSAYRAGKALVPGPVKGALRRVLRRAAVSDIEGTVAALRGDGARPEGVRRAAQNLLDEIEIDRISREAAAQFEALGGLKELKLHLGAGADVRDGWVNIDLALRFPPGVSPTAGPGTVFINYDLRRGIRLEDGSAAYVYSSHFFEHLEYKAGLRLMRDCHRVLRAGGVFRISLPNFKGLFDSYVRGDHEYTSMVNIREVLPDVEPGTETLVDQVNYGVYQCGEHKCIYDQEKLVLLLRRIGFSSVGETPYKEGVDPSDELRRKYSFYVEAVK